MPPEISDYDKPPKRLFGFSRLLSFLIALGLFIFWLAEELVTVAPGSPADLQQRWIPRLSLVLVVIFLGIAIAKK